MASKDQIEIKQTLLDLLAIPSPSFHERQMVDEITKRARILEYETVEDASMAQTGCDAGNLLVHNPQWNSDQAGCIFVAHMDTVSTGPAVRIRDEGGVVASATPYPIGLDDKAGVAVLLELMKRLRHIPWAAQVGFLFLVCEEEGCRGSRFLKLDGLERNHYFVVDSGGPTGLINNRGFGQSGIFLTIQGEDIHAGSARGAGVVEQLAQLIQTLPPGRQNGALTWNVSNLSCDGAINTFPRGASLKGELHWETEKDKEWFLQKLRVTLEAVAPGRWLLEEEEHCLPFCTPDDGPLVALCRQAAKDCGLPFQLGVTRACSDAHVLVARGGSAVKLACGMEAVHTGKERIPIPQLEACVRLSMTLARAVAEGH